MNAQVSEASVEDHLRNLIQLMKRGARIKLFDIPDDPSLLVANIGGGMSQAIAQRLEAALSAAEPIGYTDASELSNDTGHGLFAYAKSDTSWLVGNPIALYAAPPAPSVAVKALEWEAHNEGFGHGRMYYGTGAFGHWYGISRVKTGCWGCVHHIDGKAVHLPMTESLKEAKEAAQADYEARIRLALSAQVQDVAGWRRLDNAFSNFINGYGDPYEPKEAYEAETARNLKELYDAFQAYRAMLAAAPAKQEGGE